MENQSYGLIAPKFGNVYNILNREENTKLHAMTMLKKTSRMFKYTGLPETIEARDLELMLQTRGAVIITDKPDGKIRAFYGGLGGSADSPYYKPTWITVANPALDFSAQLKFGEDGEILYSDSLYLGLTDLINRNATLLADSDITMYMTAIQMRAMAIIAAADEPTKVAAEEFLRRLISGQLGVVATTALLDSLKVLPYAHECSDMIMKEIEHNQFIKASFNNEIGLDSNYNMKRERLLNREVEMNKDVLLPLPDDMLNSRKDCFEKINKRYNLNVTVEFDSSWAQRREDLISEKEEFQSTGQKEEENAESSDS